MSKLFRQIKQVFYWRNWRLNEAYHIERNVETEVNDILTNYSSGSHTYFYKNGEGEYHEIVELDLFRGRFITDDGDFSEFEWELEESHIYTE